MRIPRELINKKVELLNKLLNLPAESWTQDQQGNNHASVGNLHIDSYKPGNLRLFALSQHKQGGEHQLNLQRFAGNNEFRVFLDGVLAGIRLQRETQEETIKYALQYLGKAIADGALNGCVIDPDFVMKRLEQLTKV